MAFKMKGSPIKLGSIATKSALKQTENPLNDYGADYLANMTPAERKKARKEDIKELKGLSSKEVNELVDYETDTYNIGNEKTYWDPILKQVVKTPRTGIFSNLTRKQRKKKEDYLRTMARKRRQGESTGAMTNEDIQKFEEAGIDPNYLGMDRKTELDNE